MSTPSAWTLILLGLAAFRMTRLIGWDTLTGQLRARVTRLDRWETEPEAYRQGLDVFLHCPWCLGFWISLGTWGVWQLWPHATEVAAAPLALSALVGLVAKQLDP